MVRRIRQNQNLGKTVVVVLVQPVLGVLLVVVGRLLVVVGLQVVLQLGALALVLAHQHHQADRNFNIKFCINENVLKLIFKSENIYKPKLNNSTFYKNTLFDIKITSKSSSSLVLSGRLQAKAYARTNTHNMTTTIIDGIVVAMMIFCSVVISAKNLRNLSTAPTEPSDSALSSWTPDSISSPNAGSAGNSSKSVSKSSSTSTTDVALFVVVDVVVVVPVVVVVVVVAFSVGVGVSTTVVLRRDKISSNL